MKTRLWVMGAVAIGIVAALGLVAQAHAAEATPVRAPGESLYQLPMTLVDQDGKKVGLDTFKGHPVLISMFYATCPAACPMLISDLKRIEKALPEGLRGKVRVLLVSFDPQNDTPEAMSRLLDAHKLDRSRWRFTAAVDDEARELAALLGFKYQKLEDGGFNHSTILTILDREGVAVARFDGLDLPPEEPAAKLVELVKQ